MTPKHFHVRRHKLPSSYIREYPHATVNGDDETLHIAINQYIPRDNAKPRPGDVTIIAAHANGVGKELYEPLWDDLHEASKRHGWFSIRSIWIADVAWQGESGVLNEQKLGDDPSWFDHPRDLFLLVNHFRDEMPRPLIGVGHSLGGNNIVNLSLMHPRLFASVVLLDPVIQGRPTIKGNVHPATASTFRRDVWPSREEAAAAFKRNPFYQSWDERCFDLWIAHGLRDLPTAVHPTYPTSNEKNDKAAAPSPRPSTKPVALTTTKHQEVFTFLRSNHPLANQPIPTGRPSRRTHPDVTDTDPETPFYRPEPPMTFDRLPYLRPPCLFVFPRNSFLNTKEMTEEKLRVTGTGRGGSGGAQEDAVGQVYIENTGHFAPFEKPMSVVAQVGPWLAKRLEIWRRDEELTSKEWAQSTGKEKFTVSSDRLWWTKKLGERMSHQAKRTGDKL